MARGRRIVGLWSVVLVTVVLLSAAVFPAQAATGARTDDARTFGPAPDASAVDGTFDGRIAAPARSDALLPADATFEPAAAAPVDRLSGQRSPVDRLSIHATLVDRLSGHGSLVDRLVSGGVGVPLGAVLLGYSRQANAEPLANDVRRRVNARVRATPGAHIAAIVEATDVSRSTVRYHLNVLEAAGLITGEMIRGKHRYAPAGADLATAAALYDEPAREVLDSVARFEPVSVTGLADAVDRAPSTVSHHLDRLADVGLLERERAGGRVVIRLLPEARQHVDEVATSPAEGEARARLTAE